MSIEERKRADDASPGLAFGPSLPPVRFLDEDAFVEFNSVAFVFSLLGEGDAVLDLRFGLDVDVEGGADSDLAPPSTLTVAEAVERREERRGYILETAVEWSGRGIDSGRRRCAI